MIPPNTPIGTPCILTLDNGQEMETKTRSEVWALGHGQLVVSIEGKSGGWDIKRLREVKQP